MSETVMSPVEKFRTLKRQMPLLELTDATTEDMVEPFPAKAAQWLHLSKTALLISLVLLLAGAGFAAISGKTFVSAKKEIASGQIRTQTGLRKAQQMAKALHELGVPAILERSNILTRLWPTLKSLPAWQIKFETPQSITVDFTTEPGRDHLDILEMLDKSLKPIGLKHSTTSQAAPHHYAVTFASDE